MMLLAKMENYSSFLPSFCTEDPFLLIDNYDYGLYGRKKKKKQDVAECRLDSPCNSPEVLMSGSVEDDAQRCQKLVHSDSFTDACEPVDHGSTFDGVDMEGFYEINATMTAGEDIMLSSSAKESSVVLKKVAERHDSSKLTVEGGQDLSHIDNSAAGNSSRLQSEFENDVNALLDGGVWIDKEVRLAAPDLLPDLSGLAVSGYLLSDIPSHPDLSCEAGESDDSVLRYCSESDECLNSCSAVPLSQHNKEDLFGNIKCEGNISPKDNHKAAYCDFDALCTSTLLDDMQSNLNDCPRTPTCRCLGPDCLCYTSDVSSTEDVCIEFVVSQCKAKARRAKRKSTRVVRRGRGRPRKLNNTDFIQRGPGRPRKKSVSDAVVWYQTRRKRTVSLSNGYKSRNRQRSVSDDKDEHNFNKRCQVADSAPDRNSKPKRSHGRQHTVQMSDYPSSTQRLTSSESTETDDEDVDVVSIGDEFQELYGVSTMAELVQHISAMHNYHTQRFMSCRPSNVDNASLRKSASKFSINLSMPAKSSSACWSNSMALLNGGRHRFSAEQRTKREALNDLERRRRYALARELSALRGVLPDMKEGFRAPKVVILAAAENHIRLLERRLRRDQSILKAEHKRYLNLKERLQALAVDLTT